MADEYINKTELLFEMATSLIPQSMDITMGYAIAKDLIQKAPAANVKPIETAYWDWQIDGTHFCSECGHDALYYSHPATCKKIELCSQYCPFCGRVMTHVETPNDTGIGEYECDE